MNSQTIVMCVVLFLIGMLLAHMLKSVCGCKVVEGADQVSPCDKACESTLQTCIAAAKIASFGHEDGSSRNCWNTYYGCTNNCQTAGARPALPAAIA